MHPSRSSPCWQLGFAMRRDFVLQKDITGSLVVAKSWWEGGFHKTRLSGGAHGTVESWRSIDAGLMVVKTTLRTKEGREASMISYLEEMVVPGPTSDT